MWFNVLKLDLASIPIQGDTEGKNINIEGPKKCRQKLLNFEERLERMANRNKDVFFDGSFKKSRIQEIPEHIACKFVEIIDARFNSMASFSGHPVKREINESARLVDGWYFDLLYFSNPQDIIFLVALHSQDRENLTGGSKSYYFNRIIIPNKDYLLMNAVKKHWEAS